MPTEAEWEYAAKGGNKSKKYKFSGSNDVNAVAWYIENSDKKTHPVGRKKANELGLYDMSGNVWERCWDWYKLYDALIEVNPRGPDGGYSKVYRGGGATYGKGFLTITRRGELPPIRKNQSMGLRVVRSYIKVI